VQQYPRQIFRKKLEPDNRIEKMMQMQLEKDRKDEKKRKEYEQKKAREDEII
jgi:hypothetical protein